jgi:hypothetical protein
MQHEIQHKQSHFIHAHSKHFIFKFIYKNKNKQLTDLQEAKWTRKYAR